VSERDSTRTADWGHEDPFLSAKLSARSVIRKQAVPVTRGKERDAPIPALGKVMAGGLRSNSSTALSPSGPLIPKAQRGNTGRAASRTANLGADAEHPPTHEMMANEKSRAPPLMAPRLAAH
jgi:hypothetical protein